MQNPYAAPRSEICDPLAGRSFPWNHVLFSWKGRIPRWVYWRYVLVIAVFFLAVNFALFLAVEQKVAELIGWILYVPFLLLWFTISAKRWHDRNKSGWWVLIALIPAVGTIWALVECGFLAGTQGSNRFGPNTE